LKKINFELSQENIEFRKSNDSLSNDLKSFQEKFILLEKEKYELQIKCVNLEKIVFKFSKGEENLNKILGTQKISFDKEGIGYHFNKKKYYKNFFVKSTNYESDTSITCNYCCKIGHISTHCLIKRKCPNCIQIWVPKGTKPPNVNLGKTLS